MEDNTKISYYSRKILFVILILILAVVAILGGAVAFHSLYYETFYVFGDSMAPTFVGIDPENGGEGYFGIMDTHRLAHEKINRFDIVVSYYPWEEEDYAQPYTVGDEPLESAKYEVSRVVGMPGDTIKIENNKIMVLNEETGLYEEEVPYYETQISEGTVINTEPITLGEEEYYVMGDNYDDGIDSASVNQPIHIENIVGTAVAMEGIANLEITDEGINVLSKKFTMLMVF
ncbi:MAG: signal peptidase I [Coprobacillus sp.]|nr:signal peptidase I [Coprobacillus sp.]